jgi:hypothetical protein
MRTLFVLVLTLVSMALACGRSPTVVVEADAAWHPSATPTPTLISIRDRQRPRALMHEPAPDPRTPDQIAQAACTRADGSWACPAIKRMMRASGSSLSQPSWTVSHWYVDPLDITTCASESNNGTSATCGAAGVGPLLSLEQIANRWGTFLPTIAQVTIITGLSDFPDTDVWRFNPYFTSTGILTAQGTFKISTSTTIGVVTAPDYVAGTLGTITAQGQSDGYWSTACSGTCVGKYIQDTTVNAYFYIVTDLGSATAAINQPMVPLSAGTYATIANGDTIHAGSWSKFVGSTPSYGGSFALGGLTFQQLTLDTAVGDEIRTGDSTYFEVNFPQVVSSFSPNEPSFFYGDYIQNFFVGDGHFWGGVIASPPGSIYSGAVLDGDIVLTTRFHPQPGQVTVLSHVYMAQGLTNRDIGPGQFTITRNAYPAIVPRVWGPGSFGLFNTSQVVLIGETWASTMLLTGGLKLNGATVGYPWVSSTHSYGAAVTLNPTNLDLNLDLWDPYTGAGFYQQQ